MADDTVRLGVHELIAAYADCIDDDRLEEWPDFFVDDCRYLVTDRESHEAGLKHGIIYCASRGMLVDRVTTLVSRKKRAMTRPTTPDSTAPQATANTVAGQGPQ